MSAIFLPWPAVLWSLSPGRACCVLCASPQLDDWKLVVGFKAVPIFGVGGGAGGGGGGNAITCHDIRAVSSSRGSRGEGWEEPVQTFLVPATINCFQVRGYVDGGGRSVCVKYRPPPTASRCVCVCCVCGGGA